MKLVSIVILNWNGKHMLEEYLPGLKEHTRMEGAEIVVADNASSDGSMEWMRAEHPDIRLIELDENHGFSGGYNRALAQLDSRYLLLLNSDIEVTAHWLEPLVEYMEEHDDCGACTPKIRDLKQRDRFEYAGAAGGYMDRLGYVFCRGRIFDHLEDDHGQYEDSVPVFWGSGACLLVRQEAWKKVGGLDEAFFAHFEEIDMCWRLQLLDYHIQYIPGSVVYHLGGGTLNFGNPRKTYLNFRNNLLMLYKNLPRRKSRKIIFLRLLMDGLSGLGFLFQGSFKHFLAVIRAHFSYYGMKKLYRGTGIWNNVCNNGVIANKIYPGSIVWDIFVRRKRDFTDLRWKRGD